MTQREVAKHSGVSVNCFANWEKNRNKPATAYMPDIIAFYNPVHVDISVFAGQLKLYRLTYGLSCKAMGKSIGIDGTTIAAWQKGKQTPQKQHLQRVKE